MFIKIKKNVHGLFLHQKTLFKLLGVKHIGKKFFFSTTLINMDVSIKIEILQRQANLPASGSTK